MEEIYYYTPTSQPAALKLQTLLLQESERGSLQKECLVNWLFHGRHLLLHTNISNYCLKAPITTIPGARKRIIIKGIFEQFILWCNTIATIYIESSSGVEKFSWTFFWCNTQSLQYMDFTINCVKIKNSTIQLRIVSVGYAKKKMWAIPHSELWKQDKNNYRM